MEKKKVLVMSPINLNSDFFEELFKALPKELVEAFTSKDKVPMSVGHYITTLAEKMGWKPKKMAGFLENLWNINPSAAFSVLLREVAIELDKKYEDHIDKCKELFIISTMDGRIHKTPRAHIKNFRNFAAFRTEEDAKLACKILREDLKDMFKSGRKQED